MIITKKAIEEILKKGKIKIFSQKISKEDIEGIPYEKMRDNFLYFWDGKELFLLTLFENNFYKLEENKGEITLVIDGFRMHNYKTKPTQYAKILVDKLKPKGKVLECFMGLGYITERLSREKEVKNITSVENSKAVMEFAKINPYTKKIFEDKKVKIIEDDVLSFLEKDKSTYDYIIADPPSYRYKKARHFYSRKFLKMLLDKLNLGGKMYFYTGRIAKESIAKFLGEANLKYFFREELLGFFIIKNKKEISFSKESKRSTP